MATDQAFRDFLREEQRRRDFASVRQFAAWLGMSSSMVASVMDGTRDPGLTFMVALSQKTGINLGELVELAHPGVLPKTGPSLSSRLLAEQIEGLTDEDRALARGFVAEARERAQKRKQRG